LDRWSVRKEFFPLRNPFSGRGDFSLLEIQPPRNHRPRQRLPRAKSAARAATTRRARLRQPRAVSLLKQFGKGEKDQLNRVKKRMHRHGNKDRSAPFVGKSEADRSLFPCRCILFSKIGRAHV